MNDAPNYLTRGQIITYVGEQGYDVTRHQLVRWHKRGLLPRPRRHAKGRGQGSEARYPAYTAAQTLTILLLKQDLPRDLNSVGWYLWVLGFPVNDFARQLLLTELRERERALRREYSRHRRGMRDTVFDRAGGRRVLAGTEGMRRTAKRKHLPKVLQMIAEMQLGVLAQHDEYRAEDWERLQDVGIALIYPELLDDPELPSAEEVEAGLKRLSEEASLPKVIRALEDADDHALRLITNEAQWLLEHLAGPLGYEEVPLITREVFVHYYTSRCVDKHSPLQASQVSQVWEAFGWPYPPKSPIDRLVMRLAATVAPGTRSGVTQETE